MPITHSDPYGGAFAHPFADGLTRASPRTKGIDPASITAFLDDAERQGIELDSFMLWQDGAVVAEAWWWPYRAERPHMMHSATKSFLSAAVGFAVAEGRFGLQDRVMSFFPDKPSRAPDSYLSRMTVEDLLTQTSGHAHGMSGGKWRSITTSWIDEFLKIPVAHEPGTKFTYSSATSFMLSAIISRTTGMTAHDYLGPRLLQPLGISDLRWDVGPEGINPGGNGISAHTADLLKLAILHVQGGEWNGEQLLPREWVEAATTAQRGNEHGYHWWIGPDRSFYAYGVFGQFAWAYPDRRGVLAVTAAVPGEEEALRALIRQHLPALFSSGITDGLKGSGETDIVETRLATRCAGLRLLPPLEYTTSPVAADVSGAIYLAAPNQDGVGWFRIDFHDREAAFRLGDVRGEHVVTIGLHDWIESDTSMTGAKLHHGYEPASLRVVAGGRWIKPDAFEMTWQFVETSFRDTIVLRFDGRSATLDRSVNVNTFPTSRPTVRGERMEQEDAMDHPMLMALAGATQAASTAHSAPVPSYSTTTTTIGELLDTPGTRAVLEADAPFVVSHPRIDEGRAFTLCEIVQYAPQLTPGLLAKLDTALAKVKRLPGGQAGYAPR